MKKVEGNESTSINWLCPYCGYWNYIMGEDFKRKQVFEDSCEGCDKEFEVCENI